MSWLAILKSIFYIVSRLINCFRINTKYMNHMKTVFVETLTYQDGYRIKITILRCINQVNKK